MARKTYHEEAAELREAWNALDRALADTLRLEQIVSWLDRQARAHPVLSWAAVVLLAALLIAPFVFLEGEPPR